MSELLAVARYHDIVFVCRKCGHNLFVSKDELTSKLIEVMEKACPNCGEEGYTDWILCREGDYDVEHEGGHDAHNSSH